MEAYSKSPRMPAAPTWLVPALFQDQPCTWDCRQGPRPRYRPAGEERVWLCPAERMFAETRSPIPPSTSPLGNSRFLIILPTCRPITAGPWGLECSVGMIWRFDVFERQDEKISDRSRGGVICVPHCQLYSMAVHSTLLSSIFGIAVPLAIQAAHAVATEHFCPHPPPRCNGTAIAPCNGTAIERCNGTAKE